ncbi:dihydrolipoamide acetyltransferase component of pyruvate dehydrogenase complex [Sphaerisporangium krabiense]|uniref:Dihydrolipoamide acetyltransferase component of pyruvate dehydrogenase complex n=1 Tax=Sphaerisporangium krabiense TaxID=763782 RepID=A0A7W9DNL3_9ACTN|nr:2-oxo acid dehydrogenase subunit E2 [Sphaerisporangium krabiense]MBB5625463.1 2-oxoglutarate dehydrogenase E2 component (dihydrolipoamide succinyltransferase) [Sphaerisporangium krabiense]GII63210.1 dihydrolipoamide acetyltransferase component of pyruvate dehydrogenase complex [Sphaerisporangium krabiense]
MAELRVPKLNNNDTEYLLVEWLAADGARVAADDAVVLVETSKATEELTAGASGFLRHRLRPGVWCHPDDVIASIDGTAEAPGPEPASPDRASPVTAQRDTAGDSAPLVTAPAQALIDELGIDLERVRALGVPVVRRADVERLAATPDAGGATPGATSGETPAAGRAEHPLSRVQRAVARSVELSHQTIPAAYAVVRMDLGQALEHARATTREIRRPVGLAEVFVQAVAGLHERFPLFFATVDGTRALLSEAPNIGVTVDVGEGLYVPVVHDAAGRTTKDIATTLMKHRLAAATGEFKESDLSGANIVVTLHTEHGVVLAIPFIFPGTVCALAVAGPRDGTLADIGLAYDHRLINGRDAALFLNALKAVVERLT